MSKCSIIGKVSLICLLTACGGDEEPTAEKPDAATGAADAALPDASDEPAPTDAAGASDAGAQDATITPEPSNCPSGEVSCDGTCIAAIPLTGDGMVTRIFTRSCAIGSSCHSGNAPMEGLALDSVDHLFETAVGVDSQQDPAAEILSITSPGKSYLLAKLLGTATGIATDTGREGTLMPPPPSDPLCDSKVDAIRAWLAAGAPR